MARTRIRIDQKGQNHLSEVERAARDALELCAGRTLGDREWAQMQGRLVEFYAILRSWDKEHAQQQGDKEN